MKEEVLRDYWSNPDQEEPETTKKVTFVPKSEDDIEEKIGVRIREYERDLDTQTVADKSQIKNLARLEIGIELLTEKLSTIGGMSAKDAKALSATLNELMGQHRQLASALGIDRKSRASRGESEYEEYLPRLHKEAYEFLAQHAITIMCPHCIKDKAHTKINEGLIIFHFAEDVAWSWTSACPKCHQQFTINNENWIDFTRATIDKVGTEDAQTEESDLEADAVQEIPEEQIIVRQRVKFEKPGEIALGIILTDQVLFSNFFQKKDLSLGMSLEQKLMFADESKKVLLCTSRSVAKTVKLIGNVTKDIVTYLPNPLLRDDEILVTTPTVGHMTQLADRIFSKLKDNILFSSLVETWNRKADSPKIVTYNGLTVHFRIEGSIDDRNMTGPHPHKIYCDEMSFGNFICHRSRAAAAKPYCKWVYAGVPNNVRDTPFYKLDQTHEGDSWSRHHCSMRTANPLYIRSPQYAKEQEDMFGGPFSPDFHTQVEGVWGDASTSSFPQGSVSFNKTVGQPNGYKYYIARVSSGDVERAIDGNKLYELLRIPSVNPLRCVIGWDYGQSPDPSTFMIAIQTADKAPWQTYARISLYGVVPPKQLEVLRFIWEVIVNRKCVMMSLDNKIIYYELLDDDRRALYENRIKLTSFNSTVEIDTVTGKMITDNNKNDLIVLEHRRDGKIVKDWRKYLLTEMLKRYMLNFIYGSTVETRLELGYDPELENELIGTVERRTEHHVVYDTPRVRSNRNSPLPDQIVDATRALVDAIMIVDADNPSYAPVDLDTMLKSFGWTGKGSKLNHGWKAPWSIR